MVIFKTLFKTLNKNASSFTITDEAISNNSIFEVYPSDDSVILTDVTVNGTTANITFDSAAEYNIPCAVFINNLVGAYEPESGLPDTTGKDGKFLMVVNEEASWETITAHDVLLNDGTVYSAYTGINDNIGDLSSLSTSSKDNLVSSINEVFTSVSNGKSVIASAITDKGVPTLATDTFQIMADHIAEIESGGAGEGQTYYKFYSPVGGTKVDTFTSTMNGTLKLVAVGYMDNFATIKVNGNIIQPTDSYFIRADYYYYVYVETFVNTDDVIEISGAGTGTSSFSILASIIGDGMDIADTTAIESDVLSGKIFHKADGTKAWGTYTEPPIFPLTVRVDELRDIIVSIPRGGYNPVTYGLAEEEKTKVIPANIKKDVTILGITGTFEGEGGTDVSDTTAIESDVAAGKVFHLADGSRSVGIYEAPKLNSGQVRLSTSASTNIECGFRPKVVNILMGSSYTSVGGVQLDYVETISTTNQWVSGNSYALPTTTNNRIGSITENGFTLTKVSSASYSYCTWYAIG